VLGKSSAHWSLFAAGSSACAQTAAPSAAELKATDLKAMPRKTLTVLTSSPP